MFQKKLNSATLVSLLCYLCNRSNPLLLQRSESIDIFPIIPEIQWVPREWRYWYLPFAGDGISTGDGRQRGQGGSESSHIFLDLLVQLERNRKFSDSVLKCSGPKRTKSCSDKPRLAAGYCFGKGGKYPSIYKVTETPSGPKPVEVVEKFLIVEGWWEQNFSVFAKGKVGRFLCFHSGLCTPNEHFTFWRQVQTSRN